MPHNKTRENYKYKTLIKTINRPIGGGSGRVEFHREKKSRNRKDQREIKKETLTTTKIVFSLFKGICQKNIPKTAKWGFVLISLLIFFFPLFTNLFLFFFLKAQNHHPLNMTTSTLLQLLPPYNITSVETFYSWKRKACVKTKSCFDSPYTQPKGIYPHYI